MSVDARLRRGLAWLALLLALVAARAFDLTADPAWNSVNGTAWSDEGFWSHPAAWAAERGRWPDWDPPVHQLAPLYVWLQRGAFTTLGAGFAQARLLSVLAGLASCGILALMLRPLGSPWPLLAVIVHGTSPWVIAFDRFATPEALCIALLAGSFACLVARDPLRWGHVCAAALLFTLALAAKPVAGFFGLALGLYLLGSGAQQGRLRTVAGRLLAAALVAAPAIALLLLIAPGFFDRTLYFLARVPSEGGWPALVRERLTPLSHVPTQYAFYSRHGAAVLGAVCLCFPIVAHRESEVLAQRIERLAWLWLGAWLVFMPFAKLALFRYAYLALPVTLLGVLGYRRSSAQGAAAWPEGARLVGLALSVLWLAAIASMALSDATSVKARFWWPLLAGLLGFLILAYRRWARPRSVQALAGAVLLAHALAWVAFFNTRSHLVADASASMTRLPLGSACGFEAPSLFVPAPAAVDVVSSTLVWNPDCRWRGRSAAYVLVPASETCTSLANAFLYSQVRGLDLRRAIGQFYLPSTSPASRLSCLYAVVPVQRD